MPPVVQSLEEILAELETAYAPTRDIYNKQAALIPQKYETRRTALEGSKVKNFDNIATQANRAGMGYTGFTADEQANYLADKYLPGMQQTYTDQDEEALSFSKSLAELERERRLKADERRTGQVATRNSYEEAERQRRFEAEQGALTRAASAREAAAGRATPALTAGERRQGAISFLDAGKGRDGRVSPERYLQAKALWTDTGGDPGEFDKSFRNYVNNAHAKDYGIAVPTKKPNTPASGTPKQLGVSNWRDVRF